MVLGSTEEQHEFHSTIDENEKYNDILWVGSTMKDSLRQSLVDITR